MYKGVCFVHLKNPLVHSKNGKFCGSEQQLNTHIIFFNTDIFYVVTIYIDAS